VGIFDMGRRFVEQRMEKAHVNFSALWMRSGNGRFWKRKLSKARRRVAKRLCRYGEDDLRKVERGLPGIEQTCNWKNW